MGAAEAEASATGSPPDSAEGCMSAVRAAFGHLKHFFHREPDFYIGGRENPYLLRWWVIPRNRYFNIYLHKFLRDDDGRALHDHPWVSLSIILRGGYIEHTRDEVKMRRPGQIVFRRAKHAHRVELFCENFVHSHRLMPAWTIFITGPRIREWGFHCPQGWIHWKDFTSETDSGNIGKGCGQ